MSHTQEPEHQHACSCCPLHIGRRGFLTSMGAGALAMKMGVLDFASTVMGADAKPDKPAAAPGKCVVHVVFFRPDTDKYWMGWPGASYDIKARQEDYTKTLTEAAKKQGVQLDVHAKPLVNNGAVDAFLAQIKQSPPDGIVAVLMCLNSGWGGANHLAANKGDVPAVIFSPMGTSFTGHLQATRKAAKTFVAATQDVEWLAFGLRMLKTIWDMKNTRLCIVAGNAAVDRPLDVVGTTLHHIPRSRYPEELKKLQDTDEMRAVADYFTKEAKKIVEPTKEDVLNCARSYMVARKIMADEKCDGISMDCLGLVGGRQIPCPPCMAWLRLNDEASVGACEADWNAAISLRLTALLFERPGFMQDPAPNTVRNTLMGAHCSCPTKLDGFDKPHEPFILRSHSESSIGVSPQVLWRRGQKVTVMKFEGPGSMIVGTGSVLRNIDTPPSGGCRTSVELKLDDVANALDTKGFHQLFVYGDLENDLKAYGQLAGIKVASI